MKEVDKIMQERILSCKKYTDKARKELDNDINWLKQRKDTMKDELKMNIELKFKHECLRMGLKSKNGDPLGYDLGTHWAKKLAMKADKLDIEKIYEIKSDRIESSKMIQV